MKECPNCKELVGDSANTCFQCDHHFDEDPSFYYECIHCGRRLKRATDICICGGQATSVHKNAEKTYYEEESNIKKLIKKIQQHKLVAVTVSILFFISLCFYIYLFQQKGVLFYGGFLYQEKQESQTIYAGSAYGSKVTIVVTNLENDDTNRIETKEVHYNIEGCDPGDYKVVIDSSVRNEAKITIFNKENLVFEGYYLLNSFAPLLTTDRNLYEPDLFYSFAGTPFHANYKINLTTITRFALGDSVQIRGNIGFVIIAIFLLIIVCIDFCFPLLFFSLRHFLYVEHPEPSDLYLILQKLGWILYPLISFILLIVALFKH